MAADFQLRFNQILSRDPTYLDPFNHEADVSDAHEVGGLVNGVDGLYMAGDL